MSGLPLVPILTRNCSAAVDGRSHRVVRPARRTAVGRTGHSIVVLCCLALPLSAQPRADTTRLTLTEARHLALRGNPELVAARLDTAIARGQLRQARVLRFNPTADVLATTSGDELEAGVSQEIEIFGQRGVRISAGRAAMERATAGVANVRRLVVGEVDRTFYRLVSASQRTKLAEEVLGLNTRLADVAGRQLREGEISRLDYNLAVVELGRARARALAARREREQAAIELGRLTALPRNTPLSAVPDSAALLLPRDGLLGVPRGVEPLRDTIRRLDVASLTALALQQRPDLQERSAAARQAQAEASLARREAFPNPVFRGVMEQPVSGGPRTFRPGIGLTLPFLNRNQGERQALRAAAQQADLDRLGLIARVRAEIETAIATYESAAAEIGILESTVIAPARQNRQLVAVAYREGKVGLPVLLLIQNQAIDAELDYWQAWLAAREALATLAEATGENIEDLDVSERGAPR